MRAFKTWTKNEWSNAVTVLLLFFGLPLLAWLSARATPTAPPAPPAVEQAAYEPRRMALEGALVCLPHKPGITPTKECALGLRTDNGTHYAVDFALMSSIPEPHRVGDRVAGSGILVPIERLSTDHWRKYEVTGIFSITDGFHVLK